MTGGGRFPQNDLFSTFISFAAAQNAEANPSETKIEAKRFKFTTQILPSARQLEGDTKLSAHSKLIQVS